MGARMEAGLILIRNTTSDIVIVGMYDRYSDQPAENAALVCKYGE